MRCAISVSVRQSHLADACDKGDVLHLKIGGHHRPYRQDFHAPKNFLSQTVKSPSRPGCLQPGVSMASVVLRHGINANLVRKWIPAYRDRLPAALPAFVPINLEPRTQIDRQTSVSIEVPFGRKTLTVKWPTSDPEGCARFVRELAQ